MAHDLRKALTFHRLNEKEVEGEMSAEQMRRLVDEHIDGFDALRVSGSDRVAVRDNVLDEFRRAERAVLSNARALTEGVGQRRADRTETDDRHLIVDGIRHSGN